MFCKEMQMPPWREEVKNTARACQNCGGVEERVPPVESALNVPSLDIARAIIRHAEEVCPR